MSEITNFKESEIKIVLNTQEGQVSFKTDKIIGNLNSIILSSEDKISIVIESEMGYIIFKKAEIQGNNCLAVRNRTIASEEKMMDVTQFDKFFLNEVLLITVIGQKNKDVSLIIRMD